MVTISGATKVTGDLELDADLLDINGNTGSDGQLLKSLGGGNLGVEWINAPATGVLTVATGDANTITIGGTSSNPTVAANTGAVSSSSNNLATGTQIQAAIDSALAGAVTFKGTFNASTGQITGGSDYLYNPGANSNTIAVSVGDMYVVSVAGNFFGNSSTALNVGDEVIAVTQSTISPSNSQESYYNAVPSAGGGITGGGTTNKVPLWTGTTVLGDSAIAQSSNNIGIGTTSPSAPLHVVTSGATNALKLFQSNPYQQFEFQYDNTDHSTIMFGYFGQLQYDGNGQELRLSNTATGASSHIAFSTANSERMRIDSSGNVGIGTTGPSQKLTVAGNISTSGAVLFNDNQGINFGNSNAKIYGSSADGIKFNGGGSEKMRLTQTGDLGIGTTSPSVSLDVNATDAIQVPAGTTVQRGSFTAANGMLRYSTTDNQFEGYVDGAWGAIAGGGGLPTKNSKPNNSCKRYNRNYFT